VRAEDEAVGSSRPHGRAEQALRDPRLALTALSRLEPGLAATDRSWRDLAEL
jgi:hypothetical protein